MKKPLLNISNPNSPREINSVKAIERLMAGNRFLKSLNAMSILQRKKENGTLGLDEVKAVVGYLNQGLSATDNRQLMAVAITLRAIGSTRTAWLLRAFGKMLLCMGIVTLMLYFLNRGFFAVAGAGGTLGDWSMVVFVFFACVEWALRPVHYLKDFPLVTDAGGKWSFKKVKTETVQIKSSKGDEKYSAIVKAMDINGSCVVALETLLDDLDAHCGNALMVKLNPPRLVLNTDHQKRLG